MITIENLEKELKQNKLDNCYLFYGPETFLLESCVKKIKKLFGSYTPGINYIIIEENNLSELISNIETPAFGYEKKIILIKNTGLLKKEGKRKNTTLEEIREKIADYIEENKDIIFEGNLLIFIEEEIDKNKVYKVLEKSNAIICDFEEQKLPNLVKRIKAICMAYHVTITDNDIRYFIETCGISMQELVNEIRKLIEYTGENGTIQKKDIDKLCNKKIDAVIFDLTDSLGKKDTRKAISTLEQLIINKEPVPKIIITLYNHFKKLYFIKLAIKENKDIAVTLNLKPNQSFLIGKYKTQAGYFDEKEIRKILQELVKLDIDYKTGLIDQEIGLEAILCRYCS